MILLGALILFGAISVDDISGRDMLSVPGGYTFDIFRLGVLFPKLLEFPPTNKF